MAEEKNQKPVPSQEQSDLDVHSEYDKTEYNKKIKDYKKQATRSFVFAFTTLIAIIAVCIAWFVSNTKVSITGTQISAENDVTFEIASVGQRQLAETQKFKDENNQQILSPGEKKAYDKYIDSETGEEIPNQQDFYTGGSGVAWYMNGQENLIPGAGGKLEFYLIAKKEGLKSATIKLNLVGYAADGSQKAKKLDDSKIKIQSLLKGHILLFQHLDDKYGYYGWLGTEPTITVKPSKKSENSTFQINIPYKVTIYWKWPQYFRNYIYTQRTRYGDLVTDEMIKDNEQDYNNFIGFVGNQKNLINSCLFYSQDTNAEETIEDEINAQMSDATLNLCSNYYNQADEYIGKNAQYVYIQAEVISDTAN